MKILLISDEESKLLWDFFDKERLRDIELIVSCGDLKREYLEFLVSMVPVPLFYVPGNHDKTFVEKPPEGCVNLHGKIVTFKGVRFFGLGGCKSPRQDSYEYTEKRMEKLIRKTWWERTKSRGYDIFVTHAPARGIGDGDDLFHQGFESFLRLNEKYRPRFHFFGHQHKRYGTRVESRIERNGVTYINGCGYQILDI